jgi:hypothetical protein
MLRARHLEKWDMMRSLSNKPQTSNLSVSLKQIPCIDGSQWLFNKFNLSFCSNRGIRPYQEDSNIIQIYFLQPIF